MRKGNRVTIVGNQEGKQERKRVRKEKGEDKEMPMHMLTS